MEQIREFDSILESKFKSTPPPSDDVKPGPGLNSHQQQTFVILAPQGNVGSTTAIDFQQVTCKSPFIDQLIWFFQK
jgi:hypothetical protein